MNLSDQFVAFIYEQSKSELPDFVAHEARRSFLNVLGTCIGAMHTPEVDALTVVGNGLGKSEVSLPGRSEVLHRQSAAGIIGFAAHLDDFDDTHPVCLVHAGAAALGAVYSLAQIENYNADKLLTAFALGIESQFRIGLAISPSHYDAGWHITGTCGVIGASVAASIIAGYDEATLRDAVTLGANMTLAHRESFGTPVKPFHAGYAASNGVLAAMMAPYGVAKGGVGLEMEGGYFAALADAWDVSYLMPENSDWRWTLLENTYKAFPCGVVAHPAIEAAMELHSQLGPGGVRDISRVIVHCNPLVVELMGRPTATTGLDARFCAAHGVAVGLIDGIVGVSQFSDEKAADVQVEMLRSVTQLVPDDNIPLESATVVIEIMGAVELTKRVDSVIGGPTRPLTEAQLFAKFQALVEPILPNRSQELADAVFALGDTSSISDVIRISRK